MENMPCAEALNRAFCNTFAMYFLAHGSHWNVVGPDFTEYHDFFGMVAEDLYGTTDSYAENLRKLGVVAPASLEDILAVSEIGGATDSMDALDMVSRLMDANDIVIESNLTAFAAATAENEQGIADFLAARDDMQKKWRWQMSAMLGVTAGTMPGKAVPGEATTGGEFEEDMIFFGDRTERLLRERTNRYNRKAPASLTASAETVRAVYRRGAHATTGDRHSSGMARVDAFLRLLSAGRPSNPLYTADNDLLPVAHTRSTMRDAALVASAAVSELDRPALDSIEKPEDFVLALTELSGLGYEVEPAIRASWMRAVGSGDNPRERATELATLKYDSQDADLLPTR